VYGFGPWECPDPETRAGLLANINRTRARQSMAMVRAIKAAFDARELLALAEDGGLPSSVVSAIAHEAMKG